MVFTYKSQVVNESISDCGHKTLKQVITEQRPIVIVRRQEGLVQEGKRDHSVDVKDHQSQGRHPQQGNTCMFI